MHCFENGVNLCLVALCVLASSTCHAFDPEKEESNVSTYDGALGGDVSTEKTPTSKASFTRVRCLITQCTRKRGVAYVECVTRCQELQPQGGAEWRQREKRDARPFWKRGQRPEKSAFWKRQSDPLQSCIEAHCTSAVHSLYGACVYEKCMHTLHMRLFRDTSKRSWTDMVHTCIAFHCGHEVPGTYDYSLCVQKSCGSSFIGER